MPKFLVRGNYTQAGIQGLMKDGGAGRRAAVEKAVASLGGKVESFYFALGETDVYVIADLPDAIAASTVALAAAASGAVTLRTTQLLAPEDVDAAIKKTVKYRAPGARS
jgi:uncharacterized protein with GYD domain